jgi:hypothetical protein
MRNDDILPAFAFEEASSRETARRDEQRQPAGIWLSLRAKAFLGTYLVNLPANNFLFARDSEAIVKHFKKWFTPKLTEYGPSERQDFKFRLRITNLKPWERLTSTPLSRDRGCPNTYPVTACVKPSGVRCRHKHRPLHNPLALTRRVKVPRPRPPHRLPHLPTRSRFATYRPLPFGSKVSLLAARTNSQLPNKFKRSMLETLRLC